MRCAVVGLGGFGAERRRTLRESGAFEMVGGVELVDAVFERAAQEEGGGFRRYATVSEAAGDVEAVFICTPAHLHIEQAWDVVREGRAVFVEKPLAHDLEEARRLVEYCEENKIAHGHGFTLRDLPHWQFVRKLVRDGFCGRVVSASATSMHSGGLAHAMDNWRFVPGRNPGGPLFQCGIHKIDLLRWIFGEGSWLAARGRSDLTLSETEDSFVLLGEFGGVPCTLHCHYVTGYHHGLCIYGTEGNLYLTDYPVSLQWQKRSPTSGVETPVDLTVPSPGKSAVSESLREFARAVREHRQPIPNGRDGLVALELVVAAVGLAEGVPITDGELLGMN